VRSPANIEYNRDINSVFIHTGDEFIGSGQFGTGRGVQNSKTGVTINILTSVFLYPGGKDVGVKVDNHH